MQIIFIKSGLSNLTLERGNLYPISKPIEINQERYLTEGFSPKVVSYGETLQFLELKFNGLSKDNYDGTINGLLTWFQSTQINWSENNFTLQDELGTAHTVRLWQDKFDMDEVSPGRYSIKLTLLKE